MVEEPSYPITTTSISLNSSAPKPPIFLEKVVNSRVYGSKEIVAAAKASAIGSMLYTISHSGGLTEKPSI